MDRSKKIICRSTIGGVISCVEKNKVLQKNLFEICQNAVEDAVLMGCDEQHVRAVFTELATNLENPYLSQN